MLVINLNMGGQLIASDAYPTAGKNKACYFIKKEPGVIPLVKDDPGGGEAGVPWNPHAFKRSLVYGDLSHQPLENLVCYIEHVMS